MHKLVTMQSDINDCAPAVIYSLVKYYKMATKDKVLKKKAKEEELIDIDVDKNMENIMKNLGWS